jgi:hypothetical protein
MKISDVFLAGREFDRAAIDQMLKSAEKAANEQKLPFTQATNQPLTTSSQDAGTPQPSPDKETLGGAGEV